MKLTIGITAIIVGIIAYGVGKLSVYIRQDSEHHPGLPGNLHTRQSLFNEQARRLQEAFEKSLPVRHQPLDAIKHRMVAALPKVGAVFFAIALLLVSLALPARGANCAAARAKYSFDQLYCSGLIQTLARTD
ncbi:hypothetical protein ACOTB3_03835 [Achromobacter xylosoxidans]